MTIDLSNQHPNQAIKRLLQIAKAEPLEQFIARSSIVYLL